MDSRAYDRLKWVALVLLPAVSAAYFGLGQIWHFPFLEEVVGSIAVLDTVLGLLISKSSKDFSKRLDAPEFMGHLTIVQEIDGQPLQIRMDPKDSVPIFTENKTVQFLVRRETLK
jgi:hypothetical protein